MEFIDENYHLFNKKCWGPSSNPNLTIEFIRKHKDKYWHRPSISINPGIKPYDILKNLDLPWSLLDIEENPNITMEFVNEISLPNNFTGFYSRLSGRSTITMEDIENNLHLPWNFYNIIENPNITLDFYNKYRNRFKGHTAYHLRMLSKSKYTTLEMIKNFPNSEYWGFYDVSENPNLTFEFINENLDKKGWNWKYISTNMKVTMKDIEKYPDFKWDYWYISSNEGITIKDVKNHPELPWNWYYISLNPNITIKDVKNHPELPWNYYCLSRNPSITMKDIESNPDIPWVFDCISNNPNLTFEFFKKHSDKKWDINAILYQNSFKPNIKLLQERAAKVIQNNCWNWLNKAKTRDGKLGINVRIAMKYFYELNEAPLYPVQN